jgi:tryptophan 2,3-dioxygenase
VAVEDAWFKIHQNRDVYPDAYRLGERLLDVSAAFGSWRAKHIATVERFIGNLQGTGKKGVRYLRSTLRPNKRPFPELWSVRDRFDKLL